MWIKWNLDIEMRKYQKVDSLEDSKSDKLYH